MKTLGLVVVTYLFLIIPLHAETIESNTLINTGSAICESQGPSASIYDVIEKRGCCSHHRGVCGCSGGRVTCCDGTYSPSCTCYKDDSINLPLMSGDLLAWDGQRTDTGTYIEVESYDHQGTGEGEVEYYDQETGEYRQGYLDMYPGGSGEINDYETGETFEVEME